ncbi:hypothetical protein EV2_039191 [Malus domestica]
MKMIRKMQDVPRQMVMYLGERRQARRSIESQRTDSQVERHYTCGGESGSSGHMIGKPMEKNERQNEVQSTRNESRIFLGASNRKKLEVALNMLQIMPAHQVGGIVWCRVMGCLVD